jgi:uncharacterized protein (TIGR02453 family)
MSAIPPFAGFPEAAFSFFRQLAVNNHKTWFEAHKAEYVQNLQLPAQAFVVALGERLRKLFPALGYDPRPHGGSLMRIYRDIRFSKDKSPYKTHIGANFWDGERKGEGSGFHFFMDADGARLYVGHYEFSKPRLQAYRSAVLDERRGKRLQRVMADLKASKGFGVGGEQSKRVPAGLDPDHPRADLLRYKGLYGASPHIEVKILLRPGLVDRCLEYAQTMAPLHRWFRELAGD